MMITVMTRKRSTVMVVLAAGDGGRCWCGGCANEAGKKEKEEILKEEKVKQVKPLKKWTGEKYLMKDKKKTNEGKNVYVD